MISKNSEIMGGAACITGTRIPALTIYAYYQEGCSMAEILEDYPSINEEQAKAAIDYCKKEEALNELARLGQEFEKDQKKRVE